MPRQFYDSWPTRAGRHLLGGQSDADIEEILAAVRGLREDVRAGVLFVLRKGMRATFGLVEVSFAISLLTYASGRQDTSNTTAFVLLLTALFVLVQGAENIWDPCRRSRRAMLSLSTVVFYCQHDDDLRARSRVAPRRLRGPVRTVAGVTHGCEFGRTSKYKNRPS